MALGSFEADRPHDPPEHRRIVAHAKTYNARAVLIEDAFASSREKGEWSQYDQANPKDTPLAIVHRAMIDARTASLADFTDPWCNTAVTSPSTSQA